MITEIKNKVTVNGNPLTLAGNELKVGDKAPNFVLMNNNMKEVTLEHYAGKVLVIATLPSLDTPTCDMEVKRFNNEAIKMSDDIQILAISMDLPFAQKRWCANAGVDRVHTLSDYKTGQFSIDYGLLIEEMQLSARAVFILDKNHNINYIQFVSDISKEPDYEEVLRALKEIAQ